MFKIYQKSSLGNRSQITWYLKTKQYIFETWHGVTRLRGHHVKHASFHHRLLPRQIMWQPVVNNSRTTVNRHFFLSTLQGPSYNHHKATCTTIYRVYLKTSLANYYFARTQVHNTHILPFEVVIEFIIAGQGMKTTPSWTERVKDLHSSIFPDLKQRKQRLREWDTAQQEVDIICTGHYC